MTPIVLLAAMGATGALAGYVMGRHLHPAWLVSKWAVLVAIGVWLILWGRAQNDHFDGLGAAILVFLMIGPFFLGSLVLGLVAIMRKGGNDNPK